MTSAEFSYLASIGYQGSLADKRNAYYNDIIGTKNYLFPILPRGSGQDDSVRLQAAIDACSGDEVFRMYGVFTTTQTIDFKDRNLDASGATIQYTGTGLAVNVGGSGATLSNKKFARCPKVRCMNKPGTGWVAGTIGIRFNNCYAYDIVAIPEIRDFEVGLLEAGEVNNGVSYVNFFLGSLNNNKINHKLAPENTNGWDNQVVYIGGRYSHNSGEGVNVPGTAHIRINENSPNAAPNNHLWLGASLETPGVVEWTIDAYGGAYNRWLQCRFEHSIGNPKVRFGPTSFRNLIDRGFNTESIVRTDIAGGFGNEIINSNWSHRTVLGTTGGEIIQNGTSTANAVMTFMHSGAIEAGSSPATAYSAQLTANIFRLKNNSNNFDRAVLDGANGRLYLGSGTVTPTVYLNGDGANTIGVVGGGFKLASYTTAGRPSASTQGVGSNIFDTTLNKPIWSDGTNWRDAAGTVA